MYLSQDRAEILFTLVKQTACEWNQASYKQTNKKPLSLNCGPTVLPHFLNTSDLLDLF